MASSFNLTAQINLAGPSNIRPVVNSIQKQLNGIQANVDISLDRRTIAQLRAINRNISDLNRSISQLNTTARSATNSLSRMSSAANPTRINAVSRSVAACSTNVTNLGRSSTRAGKDIAKSTSLIQAFGKHVGLAAKKFAAFSLVTGIIYRVSAALDVAVSEMIEFDREMIRVSQVTGSSIESLGFLERTITNLSTSLGVSSNSLVKVAVTLAQAGLSAEQTRQALDALAKSSLSATFGDINDTVEGSIALMRQFDIATTDLEKALSSINAVSAQFAVESSDIIAAIKRTGGVFAAASRGVAEGTDALNQFIAIFTSVRATTRESAETIATGLRTIFTRIQRSDTIEKLKAFGVELTDLEGKFVGPYDAVRRLATALASLDPRDLRFAAIAEELGGFRQIGKVLPLLQQFNTAQAAYFVAQKGGNSLVNDSTLAQQALSVQIQKVRENWIALTRSIANNQGLKQLATVALQVANALLKVTEAIGPAMPALSIMLAGSVARKGIGMIRGKSSGGEVRGFASGGLVPGVGNRDSEIAALTPGEFVMKKSAVKSIGVRNLQKMNSGGISKAPMIDDIEQTSGSILPRPKIAVEQIIKAGGAGVDVDRTLFRTVGDQAYSSAKTKSQKDATLNTYFRDPKRRLSDVTSSKLTVFGEELKEAISSGQIDPKNIMIISKSKRVKGVENYINSIFGIPIANMAFTSGGPKDDIIEGLRTKGPRFYRSSAKKLASGGLINLAKLSPGIGNSDIKSRISSEARLQDEDNVTNKIIRKQITANSVNKENNLNKFKSNISRRTKSKYSNVKTIFGEGLAFEDWILQHIAGKNNYQKSSIPTYPVDLIPKRDNIPPAEIKYKNQAEPDAYILNKHLRYMLDSEKWKKKKFTKKQDPRVTLGPIVLYELEPGLKDKIYRPNGPAKQTIEERLKRNQTIDQSIQEAGLIPGVSGVIQRLAEGSPGGVKDRSTKNRRRGAYGQRGFVPLNSREYEAFADQAYAQAGPYGGPGWGKVSGVPMPKVLAEYAAKINKYVFETGGAGLSIGKKLVKIPDDIDPEALEALKEDLIRQYDGWYSEIEEVLPFGKAINKKSSVSSSPRQARIQAAMMADAGNKAYTQAEDAISGFKKTGQLAPFDPSIDSHIKRSFPVYIRELESSLKSATDSDEKAKIQRKLKKAQSAWPDYQALLSGTPVSNQGRITALSETLNSLLERYGSPVSSNEVDNIINAMGSKLLRKNLGGLIARFAKGGKADYYSLEKTSGLSSREFDSMVAFAKTNDFSLDEFRSYLKKRAADKKSRVGSVIDPKSLQSFLMHGAVGPRLGTGDLTEEQKKLAEMLKGPPDPQYDPKRFAKGGKSPSVHDVGQKLSSEFNLTKGKTNAWNQLENNCLQIANKAADMFGYESSEDKVRNYLNNFQQIRLGKQSAAGFKPTPELLAKSPMFRKLVNSPASADSTGNILIREGEEFMRHVSFEHMNKEYNFGVAGPNWPIVLRIPLKKKKEIEAAYGGLINRFADGGTVPALVSNGEAFVPPKLAKRIGYGKLNRMNQADRNGMGRFSDGGISVFKGPGTGTSDSIPTALPIGSFVVRAKATKALGLNKGGSVGRVQKFADGGGVDDVAAGLSRKDAAMLQQAAKSNIDAFKKLEEITRGWPADEVASAYKNLARSINKGEADMSIALDKAVTQTVKGSGGAERRAKKGELQGTVGFQEDRTKESIVEARVAAGGLGMSGDDVARADKETDKARGKLEAAYGAKAGGSSDASEKALKVFRATLLQTNDVTKAMAAAERAAVVSIKNSSAGLNKAFRQTESASKSMFPIFNKLSRAGGSILGGAKSLGGKALKSLTGDSSGAVAMRGMALTGATAGAGMGISGLTELAKGGSFINGIMGNQDQSLEETDESRTVSASLGGALSGAAAGAQLGMIFGPLGAAVGGVAGALGGYAMGMLNAKKEIEKAALDLRVKGFEKATTNAQTFLDKATNMQLTEGQRAQGREEFLKQAVTNNASANEIQQKMMSSNTGKSASERAAVFSKSAAQAVQFFAAESTRTGKNLKELQATMDPASYAALESSILLADEEYQKAAKSGNAQAMLKAKQEALAHVEELAKTNAELTKQRQAIAAMAKVAKNWAKSAEKMIGGIEGANRSLEYGSQRLEQIKDPMSYSGPRTDVLDVLNRTGTTAAEQKKAYGSIASTYGADQNLVTQATLPKSVEETIGNAVAANISGGGTAVATELKNTLGNLLMNSGLDQAQADNAMSGILEQIEGMDSAKLETLDIESLIQGDEKLSALLKGSEAVGKALKAAAENSVRGLNILADAARSTAAIQQQVRDRQADSIAQQASNRDRRDQILGVQRSLPQQIQRNNEVAAAQRNARLGPQQLPLGFQRPMTSTDPMQAANQLFDIIRQNNAIASFTGGQTQGPQILGDEQDVQAAQNAANSMAQLAQQTKVAREELDKLPGQLQGNIDAVLSEMEKVMAHRSAQIDAGAGLMEKALGSTPSEMMELSKQMNLASAAAQGYAPTIEQSESAQKAYFQTIRSGGTQKQAQSAAQKAYAQESSGTLNMLKEMMPLMMNASADQKSEMNKMMANAYEAQFAARGIDINQTPFGKIIDMMRADPQQDPQIQALDRQIQILEEQKAAIESLQNQLDLDQARAIQMESADMVVKATLEVRDAILQNQGGVPQNAPNAPGAAGVPNAPGVAPPPNAPRPAGAPNAPGAAPPPNAPRPAGAPNAPAGAGAAAGAAGAGNPPNATTPQAPAPPTTPNYGAMTSAIKNARNPYAASGQYRNEKSSSYAQQQQQKRIQYAQATGNMSGLSKKDKQYMQYEQQRQAKLAQLQQNAQASNQAAAAGAPARPATVPNQTAQRTNPAQNNPAGVSISELAKFTNRLDQLFTKLAEVSIPSEIRLSGNFDVDVKLNGIEVFKTLEEKLSNMVVVKIQEKLGQMNSENFDGDLNTGPKQPLGGGTTTA